MLNLNKVMLVGNLTRDPELTYLASGTPLAKMGMAVNRRFKDAAGERQEEVCFVDIDTWNKTAEFCSKYLKKGRRVFVEGRLRFNEWEGRDGTKRSKLSVTAERVEFADSKPQAAESDGDGRAEPEKAAATAPLQGDPTEDDLPF